AEVEDDDVVGVKRVRLEDGWILADAHVDRSLRCLERFARHGRRLAPIVSRDIGAGDEEDANGFRGRALYLLGRSRLGNRFALVLGTAAARQSERGRALIVVRGIARADDRLIEIGRRSLMLVGKLRARRIRLDETERIGRA